MKQTSRLALCGVFSAVAVTVLLATIFPFATYALPPLAGAFFIPLVIECGKRWALGAYAAVSLLALLLVPDLEAKMLFIGFFGYYPIVKAMFESFGNRLLEWLAKLVLFNAAVVLSYAILSVVGFRLQEFAVEGVALGLPVFLALFLLTGNVIFILYDIGLTRFLPTYFARFRPMLRRMFHN